MTAPIQPPRGEAEFDFAPFGFTKGLEGKRSIDILKFVSTIWRPLSIGLFLGLLGGIGAYLYLGPLYAAHTQVLVSKKASIPINDGEANRYGERGDHVQLIKTDLIVERAFKDHGLADIPQLASARDPLRAVTEGLKVTRSSGTEHSFDNVLELEYLHPDKLVARAVVQALVEAYRDYLDDTRDANARQLYDTLLTRQQLLDENIRGLEQEYQAFRRDAPVFLKASPVVTVNGMPTTAPTRYEAELSSIEQAQNENLRKRSSIQARLATLDRKLKGNTSREALEFWVLHSLSTGTAGNSGGAGGGGSAAVTASPEKANLDQQLLTARLLEQRLLHTLGEEHTTVRNVRRQIDTILDFYARQGLTVPQLDGDGGRPLSSRSASLGMDLVTVYRETLEGQLKELEVDDHNLALLHGDAEKKAKQAEMFEVEDQRRKDEIAVKKRQLEQIYDQIAAYDVSRDTEGYRLQQIAQVRIDRSLKRVMKIVGAGGGLGIVLVFCLAYFREWSDTSLRTLDDVQQSFSGPLMGAIPAFQSSADADRVAAQTGLSPTLCYFHRPGSREAEAFRSLRTSLFFAMHAGEKVLQISSPEPGDGKSTSTANLAIAIAQAGKRVLLIDCDLRRPTQHLLFGTEQEIGLTDVLLNEIDWINAVRPTPVNGLSLLPSGQCPQNPAELLSLPTLGNVLQAARSEFDIVLVDSPPVLAVSDPWIVSPHSDGLLVVVRMLKNKRATLRRTMETVAAHGAHLLGVLANGFDAKAAGEADPNYDVYYSETSTAASRPTRTVEQQSPREAAPALADD